jgi:hypothetical protein
MAQRNADGSLSNLPEGMPCVVGNCNNKVLLFSFKNLTGWTVTGV